MTIIPGKPEGGEQTIIGGRPARAEESPPMPPGYSDSALSHGMPGGTVIPKAKRSDALGRTDFSSLGVPFDTTKPHAQNIIIQDEKGGIVQTIRVDEKAFQYMRDHPAIGPIVIKTDPTTRKGTIVEPYKIKAGSEKSVEELYGEAAAESSAQEATGTTQVPDVQAQPPPPRSIPEDGVAPLRGLSVVKEAEQAPPEAPSGVEEGATAEDAGMGAEASQRPVAGPQRTAFEEVHVGIFSELNLVEGAAKTRVTVVGPFGKMVVPCQKVCQDGNTLVLLQYSEDGGFLELPLTEVSFQVCIDKFKFICYAGPQFKLAVDGKLFFTVLFVESKEEA